MTKTRHEHLLNGYSAEAKKAKLIQQFQKKREAVDANGNGTSGFTISKGKNAGKVLQHLKKDKSKI